MTQNFDNVVWLPGVHTAARRRAGNGGGELAAGRAKQLSGRRNRPETITAAMTKPGSTTSGPATSGPATSGPAPVAPVPEPPAQEPPDQEPPALEEGGSSSRRALAREARTERLAAALKANLRRRKVQERARDRAADAGLPGGETGRAGIEGAGNDRDPGNSGNTRSS